MASPTIKIDDGDILIIDGVEYEVRFVGDWQMDKANTASFKKMATCEVYTLTSPELDPVTHARGAPVLSQTGLVCTPPDPLGTELALSIGINNPFKVKQTFISDDAKFLHVIIAENESNGDDHVTS